MPQGKRKVPFSGKQKKQQIIAKRQAKSIIIISHLIQLKIAFLIFFFKEFFPKSAYNPESDDESGPDDSNAAGITIQKINYQSTGKSNSNRYALQFYKETDKQLKLMKEESYKSLEMVEEAEFEVDNKYFHGYDFPKRPEWSYKMSKELLERNENRYFTVRNNF